MGSYASRDELKARYEDDVALSHLTDTADTGVPDDDVLDELLGRSHGEADSYLVVVYMVPVDVATYTGSAAILKGVVLDIAVWHLAVRGDLVTEAKKACYDAAIAWLKSVAAGEVLLPDAAKPVLTERGTSVEYGTAGDSDDSHRVFTRATQERL